MKHCAVALTDEQISVAIDEAEKKVHLIALSAFCCIVLNWTNYQANFRMFQIAEFSAQIANTAQSLQDYTQHQIFVKANYDLQANLGSDRRIRPQIGFFGRFPFNGKRTTLASTLGVVLSVDF